MYGIGFNRGGTDVEENVKAEMTIVELMIFKKVIDDIFDMLRIRTFDIEKASQEQRDILEKEIIFKTES